jgi:hypothetical protein
MSQPSRLDEAQGTNKQRTVAYKRYAEGAAQFVTPRFAKSVGGVLDLLQKQAGAAGGL